MDESQKHAKHKEDVKHKRVHTTVWFHLYEILEKAKLQRHSRSGIKDGRGD